MFYLSLKVVAGIHLSEWINICWCIHWINIIFILFFLSQTGILEVGVSRTKAYEGLMRMKKYTHRHIVRGVKKMLGDLFKDVRAEVFEGKIYNPDLTITGWDLWWKISPEIRKEIGLMFFSKLQLILEKMLIY